ncbi:baseplate J/gp47 family protein [Paenibacillus sp. FSL H8-0317]|uniref:Phage protein gp47/JayE n=1 Tax=Paenibacillus xylanexedens TaxID=528191 RepID=A0ABS4S2C5_PAEXY|nr:baseplate J/gp47 family protein [Paenibacillus xylanexedens]MBP2249286.1 putative phage protein gp47/JayE [Paenibacillus xylanexedens]UOK65372.1 baseplate J/gp47 family protein [Paenibacillus sp. OVF10]
MSLTINDLPKFPVVPVLEETPDMIYQRWVNRAITMANERGLPPPPVGEGEYFYDLWYPIAQEIAEQQELWGYGVLQSTPIWADDEFLDAHGWADGMVRKDGESNDDYRLRILDRAFTEEGNGRRKDYEIWAKEIQGVGGAVAVEKEHHDNSIDLYLTDMNGQPITAEFAETVKTLMWEDYRIAGHDLAVHPAPIFLVTVKATLETTEDLQQLAELIRQRVTAYANGRSKLLYNYIAALLLVPGVENYSDFTLNDDVEDIDVPPVSFLQVEVMLL